METQKIKISSPLKRFLNKANSRDKESILKLLNDSAQDYDYLINHFGAETTALSFFETVNNKIESFIREFPTRCQDGCSHCCYYQVEITYEEAIVLAQLIKDNPSLINQDILETQQKFEEDTWYQQPVERRQCIFLSQSGNCNVYEKRPLACRKHHVYSDPQFCEQSPNELISGVTSPVIEAICSGAMSATKKSGLLPKMIFELLSDN